MGMLVGCRGGDCRRTAAGLGAVRRRVIGRRVVLMNGWGDVRGYGRGDHERGCDRLARTSSAGGGENSLQQMRAEECERGDVSEDLHIM